MQKEMPVLYIGHFLFVIEFGYEKKNFDSRRFRKMGSIP